MTPLRFRNVLLVLGISILSAACARNKTLYVSDTRLPDKSACDQQLPIQGHLRIKISPELQPLTTGVFSNTTISSGSREFDQVATELGVTEIRRVFDEGGRFAQRRKNYGLNLWYDIFFNADIPLSHAIDALLQIHGIETVDLVWPIKLLDSDVH